ncbi:hypothetical protein [uncultured Dialister sp.]|jgi:hypothetical protein|uniref:hypothetical protein n=1 Tax=uncultured Dialister sp. TaxID=278064 RepID=UPI00206E630E|nr:hypothetical protein [uncultured Dialister sp.]DAV65444.1 MAG TPA: tail protein [Caudoviricetes sp.]
MSKSVKINNVTYENVPKVEVPLSAGDGNAVFWDTTGATGGAADVLTGKTVFGSGGAVAGSMPNNGAQTETISKVADSIKIKAGYHNGNGTVSLDSAEKAKIISANIKAGVSILGVTGSSTVVDTSDATAAAGTIVTGNTAYVGGQKVTGSLTLVKVTQDSTTKVLTIA